MMPSATRFIPRGAMLSLSKIRPWRTKACFLACLALPFLAASCSKATQTSVPATAAQQPPPVDPALLRWSEPVGGLRARIECLSESRYYMPPAFILLQNTSAAPLTIPGGTLGYEGPGYRVDVEWLTSAGWQKAPPPGPNDEGQKLAKPKQVTLPPGKTCLVQCNVGWCELAEFAQAVRITLTITASSAKPGNWAGRLETPPRPLLPPDVEWEREKGLVGTRPLPDYLPEFVHSDSLGPSGGIYGFGNRSEPSFGRVWSFNREFLDALKRYRPTEVGSEMMRRMRAEKRDLPLKLLYAALAAERGNADGKAYILDQLKVTRYKLLKDSFDALFYCGDYGQRGPMPQWVSDAMIAALGDSRLVVFTGKEMEGNEPEPVWSIALSTEIPYILGETKVREAVPVLMELMRRHGSWAAAEALGKIGDARAVPILLTAFENHVRASSRCVDSFAGALAQFKDDARVVPALIEALGKIEFKDETGRDSIAEALGYMKAKAAVPALLKRLNSPEAIKALGLIGDPRAIEPLRRLLVTELREPPIGQEDNEHTAGLARWTETRITLARLENADPVPALCELMIDPRLYDHNRYEIVIELTELRDPRAVPFLLRVVKSNRDGFTVHAAIHALGEFKRKDAVAGLIECFDVDFKRMNPNKDADPMRNCRRAIAKSLYKMTGQTFGPDPQAWRTWWAKEGCNDPAFGP